MHDWLAMGGYAAFVWPAYAVALGAVGGLLAHALIGHRRATKALGTSEPNRKA
jgi:heme exporter protein D